MASANFLIVLLCLSLLLDSYIPASLNRRCTSTNNALSCIQESGKFLEAYYGSDFQSISVTNSDMAHISENDLSKFPGVTTVHIYDSKFLLPNQSNLLSLMTQLKELYIEDCNATEEIKDMFDTNKKLEVLHLPGNKIKTVKRDFVSHLEFIQDIDLSRNDIMHIDIGAFHGLLHLKILNLSSNKIGSAFDPIFLTLANHGCIVCRSNVVSKSCTDADLVRCSSHQALDQLWWIHHTVDVDLESNPVCNIISKTPIENSGGRRQSANSYGILKCSIEDRCSKHHIRRMIVLEMCGFNNGVIAAPEITTSSNDKDLDANIERGSAIYIANVPTAVLIGFGILFVGSLIGAAIVLYCQSKKESSKPRISPSSTSPEHVGPTNQNPEQLVGNLIEETHEDVMLLQNAVHYSHGDENIETPPVNYQGELSQVNRDLPLHTAILNGSSEDILALLEDKNNYIMKNSIGDAPIHIAARVNDHKTVESLLKLNVDVNTRNSFGNTALILAATKNYLETSSILLKNEANCNLSNFYGVVPLHLASSHGNLKMVQDLYEHDADINKADRELKTPLIYASEGGHVETVKYLLQRKANVNHVSPISGSPLHITSWNNHLGIVNELLNYHADVMKKDSGGFTPLHKASRKGHVDVIVRLLKCKEIDVNELSNGGNTPLHQAAKGGHVEAIKLLLEKGANTVARNNKMLTPLEIAAERNQIFEEEIKQLLVGNY